ncbi:MAG: hypothetical protein IJM57_06460, partial [Lachnospiraceae bacterium]|nr:hypothetical protein [Lachnospiraceae bacterium]
MRKERKNTSQWRTGRLVAKALVLFGMILCATLLLQNRVNANESQRSVYIDENGYAASVGTITTSRSSCQHQPVTFVQTQPTCGKAGLEVTQCQLTNCKEILSTKVIPATGKHSYTVTDQKDATCGVDGYKKEKCSVCGDIKTTTYKATGQHSYSWVDTVQPGCTTPGRREDKCSTCGHVREVKEIPGGHNFTVSFGEKAATCGEDGYKTMKCSRCTATSTVVYKATGLHNYEWVTALEPGCTTAGRNEEKCSVCGNVKRVVEIPGGHNFTVSFGEKAATCGEDGYKTMKCSRCTATSTVVYKATG